MAFATATTLLLDAVYGAAGLAVAAQWTPLGASVSIEVMVLPRLGDVLGEPGGILGPLVTEDPHLLIRASEVAEKGPAAGIQMGDRFEIGGETFEANAAPTREGARRQELKVRLAGSVT